MRAGAKKASRKKVSPQVVQALRTQHGWSLVETLLVLGALTAMSAGIYMVLSPADVSAQVKTEQDNLQDLSTSIDRSFGLLGSFQPVTPSRILTDDLAPARMRRDGALRSAWGGAVGIQPRGINAPNDAFAVIYYATPTEVCSRLAAAVSRDTYDIRVGGTSVFDANGLSPTLAAQRCAQAGSAGATMAFIYHSGMVAGTAVAATPISFPTPPPSSPPPPSTPITLPVDPPDGVDPATPGTPVSLPPGGGTPPPPPPVTPPTITTGTPPPPTGTPPPIGDPVFVDPCAIPANTQENRTPNCAAGEWGVRTQRRIGTYSCPEAWEAPVLAWGAWTDTSNTCTACPAPATETAAQWAATSAACASGQYGSNTWEREQTRSRSVSYNCPAGTTTLPAPTYGGWSAWTNTGATRNHVNTCVACPSPETNTRTPACPSGQYGSWTQQQTRTFNCPAGVWNAWSAWSTTSNTCSPCPAPETQSQTLSCPSGQSGAINQQRTRTFNCAAGTWNAYGSWTTTSNTCEVNCVAPPSTSTPISRSLSNETRDICPATYSGAHWQSRTVTESGTRTTTHTCPAPTGSYTTTTTDSWSGTYAYGTWTTTSNTCADPCGSPPPNGSRTQYCAAGQYGAWTQTHGWTSAAAPTCWTATSWTPASAPAGACTNCPPSVSQSETQWVEYTVACPSGQTGIITREREQTHSRTVSYSCPAGTTSLPPSTTTPWGAWTNTGTTRAVSDTCQAPSCPAPVSTPVSRTLACPVGQVGSIQQSGTMTVTAICPTTPQQWNPGVPGNWSTTSNTCSPVCAAPPTTVQDRNVACPAGETGNIVERRTQSFYCPAATGAYSAHPWTPWYVISNTCKPTGCTTPNYQWEAAADPGNQTTYWHDESTSDCAQTNRYERNWPVGGAKPTCSASNANGWYIEYAEEYENIGMGVYDCERIDSVDIRQCRDQCAADPVPPSPPPCLAPPPEERTLACPAGQSGGILQRRTANCPNPTGSYTWGAWTTVSNQCTPASGATGDACYSPSAFSAAGSQVVSNNGNGICVFYNGAGTICYKCP